MAVTPKPGEELPLILVAPNVRTAHIWCRENNIPPYAARVVKIVTRSESLRGLGPNRRITVINPAGAIWHWREWQKINDYLNILKSAYPPASYKEVWL
jgi:hypothetical protein